MAQILSWLMLIAPWFLLIFIDKRKFSKFLSVAFFTTLLDTILFQMAHIWNWWTITNNVFFLTDVSSFEYGFLPIVTIYVFYFTYPRFWLFVGTNIILDAVQAFIISPFIFEKFGLYRLNINRFGFFLVIFCIVPIIYYYQKWYDKVSGNISKT